MRQHNQELLTVGLPLLYTCISCLNRCRQMFWNLLKLKSIRLLLYNDTRVILHSSVYAAFYCKVVAQIPVSRELSGKWSEEHKSIKNVSFGVYNTFSTAMDTHIAQATMVRACANTSTTVQVMQTLLCSLLSVSSDITIVIIFQEAQIHNSWGMSMSNEKVRV